MSLMQWYLCNQKGFYNTISSLYADDATQRVGILRRFSLSPYVSCPNPGMRLVRNPDVTEGHSNRLWSRSRHWSRKFTGHLALVTCKKGKGAYSSLWIRDPSQSYEALPAICYRTVLPATRHRWMCSTLTPAIQASTRFTYPRGMEGWVDLGGWLYSKMVYLSADSHPSK